MVPGSIPKMIFDAFCKVKLIFTYNFSLEQKYKNNSQLFLWTFVVRDSVLQFVQTNHQTARFASALVTNQVWLAEYFFLDFVFINVCELGYRIR